MNTVVNAAIVAAAILAGVETYPSMVAAYGGVLAALNAAGMAVFVVEVAVKMRGGVRRYFADAWNVFDFAIVAVALVPGVGQSVVLLRLVRLLRALRLLRSVPRLQMLVSALLSSLPSIMYVSALLGLLFYVYAVAGTLLFGANDPWHFRDLQTAMLTLFRVCTLEDWTDVMYTQMFGCAEYPFPEMVGGPTCDSSAGSWWIGMGYFVSFVLLGTMIVLNLLVGVMVSGIEEAKAKIERRPESA